MRERHPPDYARKYEIPYFLREDLGAQYMDSPVNYLLRWEVYKHAVPLIDFHYEAARMADLTGDERVLDVGTGSGQFLLDYLHDKYGHRGHMVGVDKYDNQFEITKIRIEKMSELGEKVENIELIKGDMMDLRHDDNSFDSAFALFSIYHAPDPLVALNEIKRVVKPGGKVVIATSGHLNKLMHRKFEKNMAAWMTQNVEEIATHASDLRNFLPENPRDWKFQPPLVMSSRFNANAAEEILPKIFRLVTQYPPSKPEALNYLPFQTLHITPQNQNDYFGSLWSMQNQFSPRPPTGLYRAAMEAVAMPELEEAFQRSGEFKDYAFRSVYLCVNDK